MSSRVYHMLGIQISTPTGGEIRKSTRLRSDFGFVDVSGSGESVRVVHDVTGRCDNVARRTVLLYEDY
jgi:hypothetical protein